MSCRKKDIVAVGAVRSHWPQLFLYGACMTGEKKRIGFVGLGVMGAPMAGHLVTAEHVVTVFDLNPGAMDAFRKLHGSAKIAKAPKEVAEASDIVITMLPTGRHVQEVAIGPDGLASGFRPGSILLDTSSAEPWLTIQTAGKLSDIGVNMVDAPVSGAEMGAKAAELVFMVGADQASFERVKPVLNVMGPTIHHLGPVGSGHITKSINNLITAVVFMATAEGLIIGRRLGLDPAAMNDVFNGSTSGSWITRNHIPPRIITRKFDDPFKLDLLVKDVGIALKLAGMRDLDLPLSEKAGQLWLDVQQHVSKGVSVSEMVRVVENATGVELTSVASAPDGIDLTSE